MAKPYDSITAYPVEVSGWDDSDNFFVENSTLEWGGHETKRVLIGRPLRAGSVIFVRLLECKLLRPTYPIAYRILRASESSEPGVYRAELGQLRSAYEDEMSESGTRLAVQPA